jgi:hypothetical protein
VVVVAVAVVKSNNITKKKKRKYNTKEIKAQSVKIIQEEKSR